MFLNVIFPFLFNPLSLSASIFKSKNTNFIDYNFGLMYIGFVIFHLDCCCDIP